MKRQISLILFILIFSTLTWGHSGRTDKNGGHYNHKTGNYHHHNKVGGGLLWVAIVGGIIFFLFLKSSDNHRKQ